jgi:hypothetical protein
MYAGLIVAAMLSIIPIQDIIVESHDLVEINHFHDIGGDNRHIFDQIIYYDWEKTGLRVERYQVIAWRLLKNENQKPIRDGDGYYTAYFKDEKCGGKLRKVMCRAFRETWTQEDVELIEREFLPMDQRKELKEFK